MNRIPLLPLVVRSVIQAQASIDRSLSEAVEIAASVFGIVLNGLAFVITAMKTAIQVQRASLLGLGTTLSEILLRDGKYQIFIMTSASVLISFLGSMFFL